VLEPRARSPRAKRQKAWRRGTSRARWPSSDRRKRFPYGSSNRTRQRHAARECAVFGIFGHPKPPR
jgi:hypothetical protein